MRELGFARFLTIIKSQEHWNDFVFGMAIEFKL